MATRALLMASQPKRGEYQASVYRYGQAIRREAQTTRYPNRWLWRQQRFRPPRHHRRTQAAIALQQTLLQIEQDRFGLTERELELRSFDQQRLEVEAELKKNLADIQRDNITAESKALASTLAKLEAETDLQQIKNEQQLYEAAIAADIQQQITDLETQIAVEMAITDEMKEQAIWLVESQEIQAGPGSEADKNRLIDAEKRLKEARDGNQGVSGYMKQLQSELMDTEGMIVSLAQTVETELASAMSTAITGLIDGTTTAEEALTTMLQNIGKAFIDMATQMIAKAIILKALGVMFPGSDGTVGGGAAAIGAVAGNATGGVIPPNGMSIVGEQGPELIQAGPTPMKVLNNNQTEALERYAPGSRPGLYPSTDNVDISYSVTEINSMRFVTEEQLRAGMQQRKQGATLGEAKAFNAMRNKRSTRQTLGI